MHTGAISKLEYGSCVCTGDNPLADARGLSSRTDAQTILLTIACSMTFYFSFEVLLKLKPIQTNIKGGGASNRE